MADIIKYYYTMYKPLRLREKLVMERGSAPPPPLRGRARRTRAQEEAESASASASASSASTSARSNGAPGASGRDAAAHAVGRKAPTAAPAADVDTIELSDE